MGTTPTFQLPYPEELDPADVPVDMKELCDRLETVLAQIKHGGAIPGEIRAWPGGALPDLATYGHWVWADGGMYGISTYPIASGNIAPAWRTAFGAVDPGAGWFRVPDLRGLVLVGLDAMPGGARANRMTRAVAATLAGRSGEEYHTLTTAEMAAHGHGVNDPSHTNPIPVRQVNVRGGGYNDGEGWYGVSYGYDAGISTGGAYTGISIQVNGGGGAHENVPPSTFVPYIVKLDD